MRIVIVGGSVAGLATALALRGQRHAVSVLEGDPMPLPADVEHAFAHWERKGAPQVDHPHMFLARLVGELRRRCPEILDKLLAAGAELRNLALTPPPTIDDPRPRPGDEELAMLACRRSSFEWVLRREVEADPAIDFRSGCRVQGLIAERGESAVPVVRGVRTDGGEIAADLVIDASGRRSKLGAWLDAIGAGPLREESEPTGIFYVSRFYRLQPGAKLPDAAGFAMGDLGYMRYILVGADRDTFSLTFAADPDDELMRLLMREAPFEATARLLPAVRPWVDPAVSRPAADVHGMGNLKNTRRFLVDDGKPRALGILGVGDAVLHGNPIYGRGASLAVISAFLLADALREHGADPMTLARAYEAKVATEVLPWYEAGVLQDRQVARAAEIERRRAAGEPVDDNDPALLMTTMVRDALMPAAQRDATVMRAMMRALNMLDAPDALTRRPDVLQRVMQLWQEQKARPSVPLGPDHAALLAEVRSATGG